MNNSLITKKFEKLVNNKFNVYNSLFLNLPYRKVGNIGMLIPLLLNNCKKGLNNGEEPLEIIDAFFSTHTNITDEKEKIDFMFRVIQYVERQVVLYDSVEDAAYSDIMALNDDLSLNEYIHVLKKKKNGNTVFDKLSSFKSRIVLTAHPTQFYTSSVLDIIARLRSLITKNDINEIDITLQQLGLTSLINSRKPTPFDEAKNIIYFLQNVYYDAVIELYSSVKKVFHKNSFDNPELIKFGFWPGGDRDGNPFVDSKTTKNVADELRMSLMKCYYRDVRELTHKLTFREVEDILAKLKDTLYEAMFNPEIKINYQEIINPLYQIHDSITNNYNGLYLEELQELIDKVKIFRTHFASLDIRQHHSIHQQTVEQILIREKIIKSNIEELDKAELIDILLNRNFNVKADHFDDEIVIDTIKTISELSQIQSKNGEEGCNRYIISNSEDIYSVLFVFSLLKWCSWGNKKIPFDIIPLFESMEGMANSEAIMKELFELEPYRAHVINRNNTQTVMLGFSDGTKDGGYLKANWSIFKTKENLSEVCKRYDVKVIFFDGRGGPPARGGGKTNSFYASQSDRIANNGIQMTIQGQTISSKYGTQEHFVYNCEQLLAAGLSHSLSERENIISENSRQIIEKLAQISHQKYLNLKSHKMFLPYLENKSTLKYYGKANIGSRPSKRGSKDKLEFKDLRAIPFVGSWSQLKQNVPGYFGVGTAIKTLVKEGQLDDLKKVFKEVPFFKAMILNSMMSLSKCYFELTSYIAKDKEYTEFWNILYDEYNLSKEMTLLISGYNYLMEEEPVSRNSIQIRERIVLPLLVIQQYALQKVEQGSEYLSHYENIVKRSLYGNINASRNSA